jgi:hypothetical protein
MVLPKPVKIGLILLALVYLLPGALVCLRAAWWAAPRDAADAYLASIVNRDTTGIYLYSDLLGPHLSGLMAKSQLSEDARRHMWAKDFTRWQDEFQKGGQAQDSLKRERRLLHGQVRLEPVAGKGFKAEIFHGQESDLVAYRDEPGRTHHLYYRLTYPSAAVAPKVAILDNVRSAPERRIQSVVVRIEVALRPEIGPPRSWLLAWDWLDEIAPAYPFRRLFGPAEPQEVWMAGVRFAADKLSLETF